MVYIRFNFSLKIFIQWNNNVTLLFYFNAYYKEGYRTIKYIDKINNNNYY